MFTQPRPTKSQIAVVLVVVALFVGAAVGYFGGTFQSAKTYTLPTTQSSGLETCTVTRFAVWSIESIHNSTTVGGTSTVSQVVTTFETSGYPSSTTSPYTGTLTGAISSWNGTTCSAGTQATPAIATTTPTTTEENTYVQCTITGVGGFEFRVVSDSTGSPVNGESIEAVDRLGCDGQNQVVYLHNFSPPVYVTNFTERDGGWLVPDFPSQATVGGGLSFTITYQGATYTFTSGYPPVGTNCVTLHVPSGNVTTSTVMNGSGSYCS